ncbi:hypothetical protein LGM65_32280 [Burkholderia anthina]|uniref:hypothetical protein n=1 Tax=Burkholderia anthina TaxID=179879 RepID=UPI001CF3D459|nr:hypothetical protein [Burkholderia anthina]MCA8095491.1 hypothetical protein [Burkholderia anthina]
MTLDVRENAAPTGIGSRYGSVPGHTGKIRGAHASNTGAMDDLHSHDDVANVHADGVKRLTTAFQPLHDSMSDTQKKNADAISRGNGRHLTDKQ